MSQVFKNSTHIRLPAVTPLSLFHKTIATLLAPHQVLHVGHVVQTHAPSLLEVAVQVSFTAAAEDSGKRVPEETC